MKSATFEIQPQYIVDNEGNRTAVILKIDQFERLMEDLEDFYLGKLAEAALENDTERHSLDSVKKELLGED